MTTLTKITGYRCDFCNKTHKNRKEVIEIYGQYEGRSDMSYEYHFCNIECLKKEFKKYSTINDDNEYPYILKEEIERLKNDN
jgi:hypothetical protein